MKLVSGAAGALIAQTIGNLITIGAPGSLIETAKKAAVVWAVHRFWPKSIGDRDAAAIGAGAPLVIDLVNRFIPQIPSALSRIGGSAPLLSIQPGAGTDQTGTVAPQGLQDVYEIVDGATMGDVYDTSLPWAA